MAGPVFDLCVVVDDDDDILLAARLLLQTLFAEVLTVRAPEEALTAMGGRVPDVVLLDANFARGPPMRARASPGSTGCSRSTRTWWW